LQKVLYVQTSKTNEQNDDIINLACALPRNDLKTVTNKLET